MDMVQDYMYQILLKWTIVDDTIVSDLIILDFDNSAYYGGGGALCIKKTDYDINDLEYSIINATTLPPSMDPSMTPTMLPSTYPSISKNLQQIDQL